VNVKNAHTFRVLRDAVLRGYKLWKCGDLYCLDTGWGVLKALALDLLISVIREDFDAMYGSLDYRGAVVLDVGGYIGDTALWMLARGARFVHVYEPVYWREAMQNLEGKPATVYPYAVWWDAGELELAVDAASTGLRAGSTRVRTVPLPEVIDAHKPDIVKMDCEGCEWAILYTPCGLMRSVQWVIEVHGPELPIVKRLKECGLGVGVVTRLAPLVSVVVARR